MIFTTIIAKLVSHLAFPSICGIFFKRFSKFKVNLKVFKGWESFLSPAPTSIVNKLQLVFDLRSNCSLYGSNPWSHKNKRLIHLQEKMCQLFELTTDFQKIFILVCRHKVILSRNIGHHFDVFGVGRNQRSENCQLDKNWTGTVN